MGEPHIVPIEGFGAIKGFICQSQSSSRVQSVCPSVTRTTGFANWN
jgi:hypothetical protein